jgi:hypothetical protein
VLVRHASILTNGVVLDRIPTKYIEKAAIAYRFGDYPRLVWLMTLPRIFGFYIKPIHPLAVRTTLAPKKYFPVHNSVVLNVYV